MNKKDRELREKYLYGNVDLFEIRNRNETRVIKAMREVMRDYPGFEPHVLDIEDIYALALNSLPPRYTQKGSIVLHEPVSDSEVADAVRQAVEKVRKSPNYPA
jgi:fructose 1,6-bisphosphatase